MLFPKPMGFKFYRDSMRFIGVLAIIAVLGFMASAVQFVKLGIAWQTILVRALDLITIVVPPALPATLSIGTAFAISRLRKAGVFCIAPTRVNVGGKVDVVCFDKTGTLTEDGLDVLGVRGIEGSDQRMFGELVQSVHELPLPRGREKISIVHALTTCHQLKVVDGEVIGDPLDVKMFDFTGWEVEEGKVGGGGGSGGGGGGGAVGAGEGGPERPATLVQTIVRPPGGGKFRLEDAMKTGTRHAHFLELGVIRTFEFVSALRRMSVVVKRLKSSSMEIYVKGAPEVMGEICDPESCKFNIGFIGFSADALQSLEIMRICFRTIRNMGIVLLRWLERVLRGCPGFGEQAESNLKFLGLIVFENKLKPGTAPAIQTLRDAHLVCRMVTGDNPRTAVSVARECGLISQSAHVFYAVFSEGNAQTAQSKLHWSSVDDATLTLDDYSLKPLLPRAHHTIEEEIAYQDYTLKHSKGYDIIRTQTPTCPNSFIPKQMLVKAQIFARMSPDEKHELVSRLQSLGYTVCFCGDGANDCGALKAADVGLSLSEAEASVAAPFTSRTPDIGCVIEVIREGRAALVTSFSCFKYMRLSMGRTLPYSRIYPKRPTASLVSKKVLSSIIGQIVITSAFQFWAFWWVRGVVAFMTHFIIATLRLAATPHGCTSPPSPAPVSFRQVHPTRAGFGLGRAQARQFRKYGIVLDIFFPICPRRLLMASIVALTAFSTLVLLAPPQPIRLLLNLMEIPTGAKRTLLVGAILNAAICFAFERWNPVAGALEVVSRGRQRRVRGGLEYRAVEGGMVGRTGADDED
ncbi:Ca-transporting ATPase [Rhizoctonia solani AG-1 IA]|uniref:Ca-transporting ATPase n=1 Tax=Thanatephorus cucumeris (strain AG1-IA) TaxID=983506 RepID=L8WMZ3_THACA|nr:Ca-transporting ATPase [Rhizoctonia solani AG-1 IA]